jgi:pre-mRNA-processing factor 6
VEQRADNMKMAHVVMSKALQECPNSGILWAQAIEMEAKPTRQSKAVEAMRRCENNPLVILSVARLFWADRKIEKARKYFESAITQDPDLGDAWAAYYRFEAEHGSHPELAQHVLERCIAADPHHGERWISVAKAPENHKLRTEQVLKKVAGLVTALL